MITRFLAILITSLIWLPRVSAGREFQVVSMSAPELCTMEKIIATHGIIIPGVTLTDIRSNLSLRYEKCKPRDFYIEAANALVTDAKSVVSGRKPITLDKDPFPRKSESQQFRELRSMSAPEICTIRAFVMKSGVSLNGIKGSAANVVLSERGLRCSPSSFYQSIASGLITRIKMMSKERSKNNSSSTAANIVGALLKGYLAHKYRNPTLESYNTKRDESCMSDFDCDFGKSCVKAPFNDTGVCLELIDEYGLPIVKGPDTDSLMTPTSGQCDFDLDCPVAFECHKILKVCVR